MGIESVLDALSIQKDAMRKAERTLKGISAAFAEFALIARAELSVLREEGLTKDEEDAIREVLTEELDRVVEEGTNLILLDFVLSSNR